MTDFHLVSNQSISHSTQPYDRPTHEAVAKRLQGLLEQACARGWWQNYAPVRLDFTLRGTTAGTASRANGWFIININSDLLETDIDNMLKEMLPHELAHIICFKSWPTAKPHGREWKYICKELGGTGNRCHTMSVQKVRKHTKYLYVSDSGVKFPVGKALHNKIVQGRASGLYHPTKEKFTLKHFTGESVRM